MPVNVTGVPARRADEEDVDYDGILAEVMQRVRGQIGSGQVANFIPALARVDPNRFGIALAPAEGGLYGYGDWEEPFSIQSIAKVFTLALVLAREGETLWAGVGKEPSGTAFNSLVQLEADLGVPRNPFVNAGGLVITDRLITAAGDAAGTLCQFLREESGNPAVGPDRTVASSEAEHGHRNSALAHFIASYGNLQNPVELVLQHYYHQCAVRMTCGDVALAGGFLARHGIRADGTRLLSRSDAKRINALMLTCGTYDEAGEVAYRAGVPVKSGVGGGLMAIIPGRCSVCIWSPGLGPKGNSVAGVAALDAFTTITGWSVF